MELGSSTYEPVTSMSFLTQSSDEVDAMLAVMRLDGMELSARAGMVLLVMYRNGVCHFRRTTPGKAVMASYNSSTAQEASSLHAESP